MSGRPITLAGKGRVLLRGKDKQIPMDAAPSYSLKAPTASPHLHSLMLAQLNILYRYMKTPGNLTAAPRASLIFRADGLTAD